MKSSLGALEIEKARTFPSASVSGGSSIVRSIDCPARYSHPCGFSNRKDMVWSATISRPTRAVVWLVSAALMVGSQTWLLLLAGPSWLVIVQGSQSSVGRHDSGVK